MKADTPCRPGSRTRNDMRWWCLCLLIATMTSCAIDDPEEDGTIGTGILLEGTVPTNRALARNAVEIKASSGEHSTAIIATDTGRYKAEAPAGEAPYLMRVDLGNSNAYYAIAFAENANNNNRQNIHAYSDIAIRNWFAMQGVDIDAEFDDNAAIAMLPGLKEMRELTRSIERLVKPSLAAYNLADIDLQTVSFDSDDTGIDRFLESNPVFIRNNAINIYVMDPETGTRNIVSSDLPVTTDFSANDTQSPTTPVGLRVLASASNEIIAAWEPASDNIGVVAYEVLRDGVNIVTTAYPIYIDRNLQAGTDYEYTIVALDASGNRSAASASATSETLTAPDTTAPPAPINLQLTAGTASVELAWSQSSIVDVASFRILRSQGSTSALVITRVHSTIASDFGLNSGTEYCYEVVASDASGNDSEPGDKTCVTTSGSVVSTAPVTDPGAPSTQTGVPGNGNGNGNGNEFTVNAGASIQAAIDTAMDGDTIKVAGGNFDESLRLDERSLTLLGGFSDDFSERDTNRYVSVLNGSSDNAVVTILSNTGTTIDGFTIQNGERGVYIDFNGNYVIASTDITISNNIIENNGSPDNRLLGGGVNAIGNSILVSNNIIRNNFSERGAGLSTHRSWDYVIDGNLIENNLAHGYHGGGIFANGKGVFSNNMVRGNRIGDALGYGWGGGIVTFNYGEGELRFYNNTWTENYSPGPGAGVFIDEQTTAFLENELIYNNISDDDRTGAELYVDESWTEHPSTVELVNSTVYGNGILVQDSTLTLRNTIVWDPVLAHNQDDDPLNNNFRLYDNGILNITYSLLQDPTQSGVGNINVDPLFANPGTGDFHLQSTVGRWDRGSSSWLIDPADSPAIDSGDPADPFDLEPVSNGRVNIGRYGNTIEASK